MKKAAQKAKGKASKPSSKAKKPVAKKILASSGKKATHAKSAKKAVAPKAVAQKVTSPKTALVKATAVTKTPVVAKAPKALKPAGKTALPEETKPAVVGAKGAATPKAASKGKQPAETKKLTKAEQKAQQLADLITAQKNEPEVILTNADGKQYCRVHDCDNEATTDGHCRYHYLALWQRNKVKAKILQGGKLDKYIEDLTSKYPDKYLEMLRKDLTSEKDFTAIITEMDVEDAGDDAESSEEETSRFIEEVRGGIPTPDDEGDF